jgi:hypothetical protein
VKLKALFLDIDCKGKDEDSYDSQREASLALGKFIKETGLPMPSVIVGSGGSLHVYFVLSEALTVDRWRPLAHALAEATKRHGLRCDTQCTIDSARVLRVPNTLNHKTNPPAPVTMGNPQEFEFSVERIERSLEPYKVALPKGLRASPIDDWDYNLFPRRPPLPGQSDLSAGIEREELPPRVLDEVADECAFLKEAVTTGGKSFDNNLWNLTNLIATFTTGGCADAHRMGNQHPSYSKEETDEEYDRKVRERNKGVGFPSCTAISNAGYSGCQLCPHFAKGRYPLALPRKVTEPAKVPAFADPLDFVTTTHG